MHTCIHASIDYITLHHITKHTCIHTYMSAYMHTYIYIYIYISIHIHTHTYIYITYTYVYIYIPTCSWIIQRPIDLTPARRPDGFLRMVETWISRARKSHVVNVRQPGKDPQDPPGGFQPMGMNQSSLPNRM